MKQKRQDVIDTSSPSIAEILMPRVLELNKRLASNKHFFAIFLGGQLLTQTNATKLLGVYIDEHFTWKDHISYLCKQILKSIAMLFRSRFCLSSKTKLTLYYSLIYLYFTYCNSTSVFNKQSNSWLTEQLIIIACFIAEQI